MANILDYFEKDDIKYQEKAITLYRFNNSKRAEYIAEYVVPFREMFVGDDIIESAVNTGYKREDVINRLIPHDPIIQSGDFGEILTYIILSELYPQTNLRPNKWLWKEDKDRAAHFTDVVLFASEGMSNPQESDMMISAEVKTRSRKPDKDESSIQKAIIGTQNDIFSRSAKTISFISERYIKEKRSELAMIADRFGDSVNVGFVKKFHAVAVIDEQYLEEYHIQNLNNEYVDFVNNFNLKNGNQNESITIFAIPFKELYQLYISLYTQMPVK